MTKFIIDALPDGGLMLDDTELEKDIYGAAKREKVDEKEEKRLAGASAKDEFVAGLDDKGKS